MEKILYRSHKQHNHTMAIIKKNSNLSLASRDYLLLYGELVVSLPQQPMTILRVANNSIRA